MKRGRPHYRPPDHGRVAASVARTRIQWVAVLGTVLVLISRAFIAVGLLQYSTAIGSMDFHDPRNTSEIIDSISRTTAGLSVVGQSIALGNLVLLIGGCMITYAIHWGGYRKRWFFWSTLILSLLVFWHPFVGTAFGLWWLWCLLWTRSEFFAPKVILLFDSK